jgi:O-methyltransferase involved in polyketide biosynthesis
MKEKIKLTEEKETLLIPLYCKASESRKKSPIIRDDKSIELVNAIEYNYKDLHIPKQTWVTVCMRAKQFDNYTKVFLADNPESIVIHLGCGLDTRFNRVDNGIVEWFDLDFPDVIELRKKFFKETNRYRLIPSSVTNLNWLDNIKTENKPVLVLAEGLFMYIKEEEIKALLKALSGKFPKCMIVFDSFSKLTAKGVKNHPSLKKTGAVVHWGVDNPKDIEEWDKNIRFVEEWYFTQSKEINKLSSGYRFLFKIMGAFPVAKKAHRVLVFKIGSQQN